MHLVGRTLYFISGLLLGFIFCLATIPPHAYHKNLVAIAKLSCDFGSWCEKDCAKLCVNYSNEFERSLYESR